MTNYKDFQGKSLDEAIRHACDYFGVAREKLEIEIISDAKSGIFGLMGAKKASIRAARAQSASPVSLLPDEKGPAGPGAPADDGEEKNGSSFPREPMRDNRQRKPPLAAKKPKQSRVSASSHDRAVVGESLEAQPSPPKEPRAAQYPGRAANSGPHMESGKTRKQAPGKMRADKGALVPESAGASRRKQNMGAAHPLGGQPMSVAEYFVDAAARQADAGRDELPMFDLAACDREELARNVETVILSLVKAIVGRIPCKVDIGADRVRVSLDCADTGLLVGREGQTLAAVQYLASRIIAKQAGGTLRLHIDAGNYRERQADRLKEFALALAGKVKKTGTPQATRPLSAYQRRLVHLALENDRNVVTRSKGEGTQRRVVVYPADRDLARQTHAALEPSGREGQEPLDPFSPDAAPAEAPEGDPGRHVDSD